MPSTARGRVVVRPLARQFGPADRERIHELIDRFGEVSLPAAGYHYQLYELRRCLAVGLLFPALHVAAALIERFLRDLLVSREVQRQPRLHRTLKAAIRRQIEAAIEAEPKNFGDIRALARKLRGRPLRKEDAKAIERFNYFVRVPLLHGQVQRFVNAEWPETDDGWWSEPISSALEDAVDARAIPLLRFVLRIIRAYEGHVSKEEF
jgi:hypothetical protein